MFEDVAKLRFPVMWGTIYVAYYLLRTSLLGWPERDDVVWSVFVRYRCECRCEFLPDECRYLWVVRLYVQSVARNRLGPSSHFLQADYVWRDQRRLYV